MESSPDLEKPSQTQNRSALETLRETPSFSDRLASLSDAELYALVYDWEFQARPNQLAPAWDWGTWLILAGRGFGKTRVGAEMVRLWIRQGFNRVNFIAPTVDDLRDVMVEGESGILAVCPRDERPVYRVSKRRLEWPNGARSLLFSAEEPNRLRGKQHEKLWCFIRGTMIATPLGNRPIENLRIGDEVLTRHGVRRVCNVMQHPETVGTVRLSNGAELTGTGNHPLLSSCGWANLSKLSAGQSVATVTLARTSGNRARAASAPMSTCTALYGSRRTAQSRPEARFTTETRTRSTTRSTISNVSLRRRTEASTASSAVAKQESGRPQPISSPALAAVVSSFSSGGRRLQSARNATPHWRKKSASRRESASSARRFSIRARVNFAVNVASTWEPAGIQIVYNLTIEREHEYVANGVIVHNCDEPASWRYDVDCWDQAQFGLRLGKNPQTVATTTPRPTKLIRTLLLESHAQVSTDPRTGAIVTTPPTTAITRGTTYENRSNLARGFYSKIIAKYENTRLGRQELLAEILDDNPGALFHLALIEAARVKKLPPLVRIVVAMDPATTSNEDSDEWGIIAAGQDGREPAHFYILADESGIYTPDEAGKQAVRLYHRLGADRLVGEANNGGDMIETIVRYQDANVAYKKVTASRGKATRAEPISALYEQARVHHHGMFAQLEDQSTTWNPKTDDDSPDRMDAMVWAVTELASGTDGWAGFVKGEGKAAQAEGLVPASPGAPAGRVDLAGNNHDVCVCGSTFWVAIAGKEYCLKCQTLRPSL